MGWYNNLVNYKHLLNVSIIVILEEIYNEQLFVELINENELTKRYI